MTTGPRLRGIGIVTLVLGLGHPGRVFARTFADILDALDTFLLSGLEGESRGKPIFPPLKQAMAKSIGRSLPVISASSGFAYKFNPETGAWERENVILG